MFSLRAPQHANLLDWSSSTSPPVEVVLEAACGVTLARPLRSGLLDALRPAGLEDLFSLPWLRKIPRGLGISPAGVLCEVSRQGGQARMGTGGVLGFRRTPVPFLKRKVQTEDRPTLNSA